MLDYQIQKLCQIEMVKARIAAMQAHNLIEQTNGNHRFYPERAFQDEVQELANIADSLRG